MTARSLVPVALLLVGCGGGASAGRPPAFDAEVVQRMAAEEVPGLAIAVVEHGRVTFARAYGYRDREQKLPLRTDTIMYAASLTKPVFAAMVLQLVDEGVLDLDATIDRLLPKPLPAYEKYADLAHDERWRKITPRILLSHRAGFPNWRFMNDDGKLDIQGEPGSRYAYSGEGINLLQFVLEEGLGLNVGAEMQRRIFDRFGMKRTSMTWRPDFADNATVGYYADGRPEPHKQRGSARAAGSMDTTLDDYALFLAAFARGDGLSPRSRAEMLRPQIAIPWAHQFPTRDTTIDPHNATIGLAAGLGWVLFHGPRGASYFKGGHEDWAANQAVCTAGGDACVVLLSNGVRAEAIFPALVGRALGEVGVPWSWEYHSPVHQGGT